MHDVFHISILHKYVPDLSHVLVFSYLDVRILRNKRINIVKVAWQHHSKAYATWELEDEM